MDNTGFLSIEQNIPTNLDWVKNNMEEDSVTTDTSVLSLTEDSDKEEDVQEENLEHSSVIAFVKNKYEMAKSSKEYDERRMLECYRNYRGLYGPDVQFTDTEKSRAFIKITKTKVLAAYGKISDVLFSNLKFPIGVEPTPIPEGIAESVNFDLKAKPSNDSEQPDVPGTIKRSSIHESIRERLGPLKDTLGKLPDSVELKEGVGKTPSSFTFSPAEIAAHKMEKKIHDQLEEAQADKALRSFVFEMALFGTGIMKGPFAKDKEYANWDEKGTYKPVMKAVADVSHVSVWNFYPDPDARTISECEFVIERHKFNKSELRSLKKRPFFRNTSINLAIDQGPNYIKEDWEEVLGDNQTNAFGERNRYEVLEYWGIIDRDIAEEMEIEIPKRLKNLDEIQVNIWICNNQILRFVLNPFTPNRIPYYNCPYEVNPYSFFGVGIAENMIDTQLVMNGFMRLAIDNAALSSNLVFEVDESNLVPGQDMRLYPGKVFRRQAGAPGQAIFATKYPNVTQECLLMFDKARQLSDEATGMPSYAHGISGIMSTGRTASGMSMLMGAADINIKAVVRNIDDYLLIPLGKNMFAFNMQFDFDKDIKGDLDIVARGTESLMRNEVRSQKLLQFLQITGNPMDAPFVKRDYILRELAKSLDLDPEKIVNDPREAGIQAAMMKDLNMAMGVDPNKMMGAGGNPAGAPNPSDPTGTGGGNIAPGNPKTPDEQGFSMNGVQGNPSNTQA